MSQEQLNAIGHEIRTQDNRATQDPLFCVFEIERIYGVEDGYTDKFEWVDDDGDPVDPGDYADFESVS